jgi:hypothetical protein
MAWRILAQAIESGVVVDPRDVVRNESELAQELAGLLDRDNVGLTQVTPAKPVAQAFVAAGSNPQSGAPLQTLLAGQSGIWTEFSSISVTPTLSDGEVIVDADVCASAVMTAPWTGAGAERWQARLLINGATVAYTGWTSFARLQTTVSMTGSAPVTTGTCAIQVQVRAWTAPIWSIPSFGIGKDTTNTFANNPIYTGYDLQLLAGNIVWVNRKR